MIPQSPLHFELEPQINSDYHNFIIFREEYKINPTSHNRKTANNYLEKVIRNKKLLEEAKDLTDNDFFIL